MSNVARDRHDAFVDCIDNPICLREEVCIQFVAGSDPVACADNNGRCIQIIECKLGDVASDIVQVGTTCASIGSKNNLTGLLNGFQNLFVVEGYQRTSVDNFSGDTVLFFQLLSCFNALVKGCADGDDGDIRTFDLDVGFADFDFVAFTRYAAFVEVFSLVVKTLAFEEDNRVRTIQSGGQKTLCIVGSCGEYNFQARNVCCQSGPVLRVLCTVLRTNGNTKNNGGSIS